MQHIPTLSGLLLALLLWAPLSAHAQQGTSVVVQPRIQSAREYLTGDSLDASQRQSVPGQTIHRFSAFQDSAYVQALRSNVSASLRFATSARLLVASIESTPRTINEPTPAELVARTMSIPSAFLLPSGQEVLQQQIAIANSQYVPGVLLRPMGTGNLQVGLNQIASFFGLTEDVSPTISYVVEQRSDVEVVVYSTQARIIATVFRGTQPPGSYEVTWNGRDESGKGVMNGDYVAEVRIGTERLLRKRMVWPPQ